MCFASKFGFEYFTLNWVRYCGVVEALVLGRGLSRGFQGNIILRDKGVRNKKKWSGVFVFFTMSGRVLKGFSKISGKRGARKPPEEKGSESNVSLVPCEGPEGVKRKTR